jgi:hypothetical protein
MINPQTQMPQGQPPMGGQGMPQQPQQPQQMTPDMLPPQLQQLSLSEMQSKSFQLNKIPKKLQHYMEMDNIAEELDDEQLSKIAEICTQGY